MKYLHEMMADYEEERLAEIARYEARYAQRKPLDLAKARRKLIRRGDHLSLNLWI